MTPKNGFPMAGAGERESVLRYLRLAAGLSREALAKEVGLTVEDIELFETGSRWLPLELVIKLSDYFCVSCTALLWDDMEEVTDLFQHPIRRETGERRGEQQARQTYRRRIGDAGEAWVAELEREKLVGTAYANAVNPNYSSEETAHFDILSFTPTGECVYIEVKSTAGEEGQPFFLTASELQFAEQCLYEGKRYELHRVSYVTDPERRARTVYTAQQVLELFDRIPSTYLMCRKEAV